MNHQQKALKHTKTTTPETNGKINSNYFPVAQVLTNERHLEFHSGLRVKPAPGWLLTFSSVTHLQSSSVV